MVTGRKSGQEGPQWTTLKSCQWFLRRRLSRCSRCSRCSSSFPAPPERQNSTKGRGIMLVARSDFHSFCVGGGGGGLVSRAGCV